MDANSTWFNGFPPAQVVHVNQEAVNGAAAVRQQAAATS